eukprot:gb/GEZN01017992.1/.p1 GENE.gb/GEZN01017992.1/~~gb/GEZN01017992.1/.p1  ORF type:complete len:205 (+),score=29.52 gb/GEZN01017992.1/:39-653(+)
MAKKKGKEEVSSAAPTESAQAEPANFKTNLNDPVSIKHCLDEQLCSWMKDEGFAEDVFFNNVKLILGFTAVAIAAFAQFYWVPFPESRNVLALCVAAYVLITAYLTLQDWLLGPCIFLATRQGWPRIRVNTTFMRWEREYEVFLADRDTSTEKSYKLDCTNYFDVNGHFLKERYASALSTIMQKFQEGKGGEEDSCCGDKDKTE